MDSHMNRSTLGEFVAYLLSEETENGVGMYEVDQSVLGDPPVKEPPNQPKKPPVEEPKNPRKRPPPPPDTPPVEDPNDVPPKPPVREPPPEALNPGPGQPPIQAVAQHRCFKILSTPHRNAIVACGRIPSFNA
jgi:hypothetical protein